MLSFDFELMKIIPEMYRTHFNDLDYIIILL